MSTYDHPENPQVNEWIVTVDHPLESSAHQPLAAAIRPPYRVAPRFLAGLDDGNVGPVIDELTDAGWTAHTDADANVRVYDPTLRLAVEFLPEARPLRWIEDEEMVWVLSASPSPDSPLAWTALFTNDIPNEILIPTVTALASDPEAALTMPLPYPVRPDTDDTPALAPLISAGWSTAPAGTARAYQAPSLQASFTHHPPYARAVIGEQARAHWAARTHYYSTGMAQWAAIFDDTTPTHLLTAFTTALADPTPVHRYELPRGSEAHLTLTPA